MNFNDLLVKDGVDPKQVLVLRHRPMELALREVLPWLAAEKPDVFNAYQQTQGRQVESAMQRAKFVASFIGHQPARAVFIGLYGVGKSTPLTRDKYWRHPAYLELKKFGMRGFQENDPRNSVLWFELEQLNFHRDWKGKLIVRWHGERSWYRRAHLNQIPVHAVLEDSVLDAAMPNWDEISLTWEQLKLLPMRWRVALSEWRGIYYIFDTSDGKGYVGAAYGEANLYGRWTNYAAIGHGGNASLRKRDPNSFVFTILQRVSPDLAAEDVIRLECNWKERLHTRKPYGLNEN